MVLQPCQQENGADTAEGTQAIDMLGPEGVWLADGLRSPHGLLNLEANMQIPNQQPEPDGNPIGMQAVADGVVETVAIHPLLDCPPRITANHGALVVSVIGRVQFQFSSECDSLRR